MFIRDEDQERGWSMVDGSRLMTILKMKIKNKVLEHGEDEEEWLKMKNNIGGYASKWYANSIRSEVEDMFDAIRATKEGLPVLFLQKR
ncbi:uncharacterized protein HKW66_Vig0155400 [Vigna angularis]|uniref:Uncharacterized protein n=1 Tax=Phaseolus angularis TaxID=3914 RepID=A0A8T0JLI6_PHAAN|nr:uncharacterized protein HKW66_Vig0155400 [Vigna angularis]